MSEYVFFDGDTYEPDEDEERLKTQLRRVFRYMSDGREHTLAELSEATGGSEAAVSARLRDFRKPRFGCWDVRRRRIDKGLFGYTLVDRPPPETEPEPVEPPDEPVPGGSNMEDTPDFKHWSASRFMTFEMCPREFEKSYVFGLREEASEAMLFGSAVHQGLEAHFNGADGIASFRGVWRTMKEELLGGEASTKLTAIGMDLIDLVVQQGWSGLSEYVFNLDTAAGWGYPTIGAIDLIDCSKASEASGGAGGIVVRDFKTTTGAWGWSRARRDPWQPFLYCWAVHDKFGVWPAFEYVVLNKVTRDLTVFRLEPDETAALDEDVNERAQKIAALVQAGNYECHGKHGDCLECGAKWSHEHVCDLSAAPPRVHLAGRPT